LCSGSESISDGGSPPPNPNLPAEILQRKDAKAQRRDLFPEPEPGRCSWERWRLAGEFWFFGFRLAGGTPALPGDS